MKTWISILIVFTFIACTQAGGKKESTPITDTLHPKPKQIMIDSIYALTPLFERKYDPQTGLEVYNEEFIKDRKTSVYVHTGDGWLINVGIPGQWSGGLYIEYPPTTAHYYITKEFHLNGKLKSIEKQNEWGFKVGIGKEYDERGNLIKEIDYSQDVEDARISFEDALRIYDRKGLFDLKTVRGYKIEADKDGKIMITNPDIHFNYTKRNGILFWLLFGAGGDEKYRYTYEINAQTGEMNIQKEERPWIEY